MIDHASNDISQTSPPELVSSQGLSLPVLANLERTEPGPPGNGALLAADSDQAAVASYLDTRCKKATTRKAVMRDLRKLAFFMQWHQIGSLADFSLERCLAFQQWLLDPPAEHCLGGDLGDGHKQRFEPVTLKNGQPNPRWRPFAAPLSAQVVDQTIAKMKALFGWLAKLQYLNGNPWWALDSAAATKQKDEQVRELSLRCIQAVIDYLEYAPNTERTVMGLKRIAHHRWLFLLYLLTGSRATAVTTATTDDIKFDRKGVLQLNLKVKGKGDARLSVPWIEQLEEEYRRYLRSLGVPANSVKHLVLARTNPRRDAPVSYNSIQHNIKDLFRSAATWAEDHTDLESWEVDVLNEASAHWIRHGTATLLESHAKDQLGHGSHAMTERYQHKDLRARVQALADLSESLLERK